MLEVNPMIKDNGPMYHEFIADAFIKEPWNAYSSLFFLIPVIFWIWRLRGQYRKNWVIVLTLPFLFLNGAGSTLYHAFRNSNLFLFMDFMPAVALCIIVATYFWTKILGKWYWGLLIILSAYFLAGLTINLLVPILGRVAGNMGYFIIGLAFLLPTILNLFKTKFYRWDLILISIFLLLGSIIFRSLDHPTPNPFPNLMPQGTHFLWHIFSALSVFSLGYYIYFQNQKTESKIID
jgi:hypothetical protein